MRHSSDLRTLLFVAVLVVLRGLIPAVITLPYWAAFPLFSVLGLIHFSIAHNHIHQPIFRNSWLNRGLDIILSILVLDPLSNLRCLHIHNHHMYSETAHDVMHSKIVPERWRRLNMLTYPLYAALNVRRERKFLWGSMPGLVQSKKAELVAIYAFLLLNMVFAGWHIVLNYYILPSLAARWLLALTNLVQHDGCDAHDRYNAARNFTHPLFNWFFFNSGFHMAHHLRSGLHWSRLPDFHYQKIVPHCRPSLQETDVFSALFKFYVLGKTPTQ